MTDHVTVASRSRTEIAGADKVGRTRTLIGAHLGRAPELVAALTEWRANTHVAEITDDGRLVDMWRRMGDRESELFWDLADYASRRAA